MEHHIKKTVEIGELVRNFRKAQNLTQEDLSGMANVGRRFISDLENGKDTVQFGKVLLVLRTLGLALYGTSKWDINS